MGLLFTFCFYAVILFLAEVLRPAPELEPPPGDGYERVPDSRICSYCDAHLHVDARGHCRNCGAAE